MRERESQTEKRREREREREKGEEREREREREREKTIKKICLLKLSQEDLPFKAPSRSVKKICPSVITDWLLGLDLEGIL